MFVCARGMNSGGSVLVFDAVCVLGVSCAFAQLPNQESAESAQFTTTTPSANTFLFLSFCLIASLLHEPNQTKPNQTKPHDASRKPRGRVREGKGREREEVGEEVGKQTSVCVCVSVSVSVFPRNRGAIELILSHFTLFHISGRKSL